MASVTENGVGVIWEQVKAWPSADRIALASRILQSLEREVPRPAAAAVARKMPPDIRGALVTDKPPPTDEEVERILEEERLRKFG